MDANSLQSMIVELFTAIQLISGYPMPDTLPEIHRVQRRTGKFEPVAGTCRRKNAEELEAYEIQNRYLSREGESKRALAIGWVTLCRDVESN